MLLLGWNMFRCLRVIYFGHFQKKIQNKNISKINYNNDFPHTYDIRIKKGGWEGN